MTDGSTATASLAERARPLAFRMRELLGEAGLGSSLARGAAGSLGLHIVSSVLGLLTAIVLAHLLGASEYGIYSLAMIYANLLGLVACLGFPQLIVRYVAQWAPRAEWGAISRLVRTALVTTVVAAAVLAGAGVLAAPHVVGSSETGAIMAFAAAMTLVLLIGVQRIGETALLGFERPLDSLLPERLLRPAAFLVLVVLLALLAEKSIGASGAVGAHIAAYLVSLAGVLYLIRWRTPSGWWRVPAAFEPLYLKEAAPLLAAGLMTILSTRFDVMMLGWLAESEVVGQYRFASQLASLALIIAVVGQANISPAISRHHSEQRLADLRPLLRRLAFCAGLAALTLAGIFAVAFDALIPLVGASFAPAKGPLIVLMAGYALTAALFYALPLLTMTGHASDVAFANGLAILCNAALAVLLVPAYGADGAALATFISLAVLNGLQVWNVRRRLGLAIP